MKDFLMPQHNVHANVPTSFINHPCSPQIDPTAYIHPAAVVIGDVTLGRRVMVCPFASVRGDEGVPIFIGDDSNVQDSVVLHALETFKNGRQIADHLRSVKGRQYAIYIGRHVSLAHQSQIHGPAVVMDDTLVGMQALVFKATIGPHCVIEPAAKVLGVEIPPSRYVPAGAIINSQAQADALPTITPDYPMRTINADVVHVNTQLADAYRKQFGEPAPQKS